MSEHYEQPVDSGESEDGTTYTIEQVATRTGLTKRTLRYYEEMQLLPQAARTEGNYRRYAEADVQRIQKIKELRDLLGFSLNDIRDILQADDARDQIRVEYRNATERQSKLTSLERSDHIIRQQLQMVEQKISGLERMREALQASLTRHEQLKQTLKKQHEYE